MRNQGQFMDRSPKFWVIISPKNKNKVFGDFETRDVIGYSSTPLSANLFPNLSFSARSRPRSLDTIWIHFVSLSYRHGRNLRIRFPHDPNYSSDNWAVATAEHILLTQTLLYLRQSFIWFYSNLGGHLFTCKNESFRIWRTIYLISLFKCTSSNR